MQFSCNRQRLADILALLSDAVPSRSPKAVLQNIHIVAGEEPDTLILSATDLEIGLRHRFEVANLSDPEEVLLPAARLTALMRDDRSAEVHFLISGQTAKIKTEFGQFQLHGAVGEDFPVIPDLPAENRFRLAGDDIADAAQKTLFTAARDEMRFALKGVFFSVHDNACEFVSSDTHRLSRVTKRIVNPDHVAVDGIAITKGVSTLAKMSAGRESVVLCLTDKQLIAHNVDATLTVRLLEGQFPRYREVIPDKLEKRITVNREELAWRLRNLGVMANEVTRCVVLESRGEDGLVMCVSGNESGDGRMEMEADVKGGDFRIAFNYMHMLDLIKVVDEEKITLQSRDESSPVRVDSGDFTHVFTQIRPQ